MAMQPLKATAKQSAESPKLLSVWKLNQGYHESTDSPNSFDLQKVD
jgi:hypothetical protein